MFTGIPPQEWVMCKRSSVVPQRKPQGLNIWLKIDKPGKFGTNSDVYPERFESVRPNNVSTQNPYFDLEPCFRLFAAP